MNNNNINKDNSNPRFDHTYTANEIDKRLHTKQKNSWAAY